MPKTMTRALLGLSIAVASLVTAGPASATVWKNFANEAYCLAAANNKTAPATPLILWQCDNSPGQQWGEITAPWNASFVQMYSLAAPVPALYGSACVDYNNENPSNGDSLNLWTCNVKIQFQTPSSQGWHPSFNFGVVDGNGHQCYNFINELAEEVFSSSTKVFGVSGGIITNGRPIILWDLLSSHADQYWCQY